MNRWLAAAAVCVAGCGDDPAVEAPLRRWDCPPAWVATDEGGCGPAVLLCATRGGAAADACRGVDLARPTDVVTSGGESLRGFARRADGTVTGAWPEATDPDAPHDAMWSPMTAPAADWRPTAGVVQCPMGWTLRNGACDPMLPTTCLAGSEALPGGRCTTTTARDCPATTYAALGAEADGAAVLHVNADASGEADGSEARPFATIAAALDRARDGVWVRVAAGTYATAAQHRVGTVHLVGVCAARTTLRSETSAPVIDVTAASATMDLRDVTIAPAGLGLRVTGGTLRATRVRIAQGTGGVMATGTSSQVVLRDVAIVDVASGFGGVTALAGATVTAAGLSVQRCRPYGVAAASAGTVVDLTRTVVRDTRADDPQTGMGADVEAGARLHATSTVFAGNVGAAVRATGRGTRVELADVVASGTRAPSSGVAAALRVEGGAALDAQGLTVSETTGVGVGVTGAQSDAQLRDTTVATTHAGTSTVGGRAVEVNAGGSLRATGLRAVDADNLGVVASGRAAHVELTDAVIERAPSTTRAGAYFGLMAQGGATARATRLAVIGSPGFGVYVAGEGTAAQLDALLVANTRETATGAGGRGIAVREGATVTVTGARVDDTQPVAVAAQDPGSALTVTDAVVSRVRAGALGAASGVVVAQGATGDLTDVVVASSQGVGVSAQGARATLTRCVLRDGVLTADGALGFGAAAVDGATLTATSTRWSGLRGAAVVAIGAGTAVTLRRDHVEGTLRDDRGHYGYGVFADQGASVEVRATSITGNASVAVLGAGDGTRVSLAGCLAGASTDDDPQTPGRGVEVDRGATLSARALWVTDAHEIGVFVAGASATLDDVVIARTAPSRRGFGVGLYATGGSVQSHRLAVDGASGAAVAAITAPGASGGAGSLSVTDLFARDVASSTVRFSDDGHTVTPEGAPVAWGLCAGRGATVTASRAVLDAGDHGLVSLGGSLRVDTAVVARQRVAGTLYTDAPPTLVDVSFREGHADARRDPATTSPASLTASPSVCDTGAMCW